jgi:hypothetical protein
MKDHPEFEQLSAYLDGELDAGEQARLDAHVPGCAECTATLDALRATLADLEALPEAEMSAVQIARLDAVIDQERVASRARSSGKKMRIAWAAGGIAASLIAIVALTRMNTHATGPTSAGGAENAATSAHTKVLASEINYNEASAKARLTSLTLDRFALSAGGGTAAGGNTGETRALSPAAAPYAADSAALASAPPELTECDRQIRGSGKESLEPSIFELAKFKGTPAFILAYLVPAGAPTRAELWVVRRTDCFTLYFAQAKLS